MDGTISETALTLAIARARLIYIADDDAMFRESIVFLLESAGFSIAEEMTPRAFIEKLPELPAGIVLVDLRMPDIDGFDLIRLIGDRIMSFPVIVITGHGDIASAVRATNLGAVDFLEKPVRIGDLVESILAVMAIDDNSLLGKAAA